MLFVAAISRKSASRKASCRDRSVAARKARRFCQKWKPEPQRSFLQAEKMIMMLRETLDYDRLISEDDTPSPDDNLIANLNKN
jgi:hypothetical protein